MKVLYPVPNAVSIWVGTFPSEFDFDQRVDGPIAETLKLEKPLASICEISFEPTAIPVRKLLEGFSGWKSFVDEAVRIAKKRDIDAVNAALVCYYLKCEDAPEVWDEMHFLGSFVGRDVEA